MSKKLKDLTYKLRSPWREQIVVGWFTYSKNSEMLNETSFLWKILL
jgi:hypothetical protein